MARWTGLVHLTLDARGVLEETGAQGVPGGTGARGVPGGTGARGVPEGTTTEFSPSSAEASRWVLQEPLRNLNSPVSALVWSVAVPGPSAHIRRRPMGTGGPGCTAGVTRPVGRSWPPRRTCSCPVQWAAPARAPIAARGPRGWRLPIGRCARSRGRWTLPSRALRGACRGRPAPMFQGLTRVQQPTVGRQVDWARIQYVGRPGCAMGGGQSPLGHPVCLGVKG
jgi:hypothetical protein